MSYSPPSPAVVIPMVGGFSQWTLMAPTQYATLPASAVWMTANTAVYVPIVVPVTCVIRRLWWANGATVNASYNLDCGVYADAGYKPGVKLIATGSTAQGTASEVQFVDVTDTTLAPGRYWLALSCSSVSATVFRGNVGVGRDATLYFTEASALPLPATATPAEPSASATVYPLCGFATTASP